MLKNFMEELVDTYLPTLIVNFNYVCKCEKCILDIKALALNNLKPLYLVTEKGEVYSKNDQLGVQYRVDVINQLAQSIQLVSKNPRHTV